MSYSLDPTKLYRMPASFGPAPGARNLPPHIVPDHARFPRTTRCSFHFLTDGNMLSAMLPAGLRLAGEPIATVYFSTMKGIEWLAGRGYNVLSFSVPATYEGKRTVTANFKPVLWEGLPDPCITGREELGFNKLWAEIPDPRVSAGRQEYSASWLGFVFAEATFEAVEETASGPTAAARNGVSGTINHKLIPRSGQRGAFDASYLTYWPQFDARNVEKSLAGKGSFRFNKATWEQLPTMHHVVNRLAELPVKKMVGCEYVEGSGQGDVSNIEILV
ncbi:MAG: acetoacetate decarboxylase family protein [Rhizobiales bacterium]|nr:acetoacetate decarboxylase family protein [Hyphomicrobiales bacterium]